MGGLENGGLIAGILITIWRFFFESEADRKRRKEAERKEFRHSVILLLAIAAGFIVWFSYQAR